MVAVYLLLCGALSLDDTFCVYGPYLVVLVLEILVAAAKLRHGVCDLEEEVAFCTAPLLFTRY